MKRKRAATGTSLKTLFPALLLTTALLSSGAVPVCGMPDQVGGAAGTDATEDTPPTVPGQGIIGGAENDLQTEGIMGIAGTIEYAGKPLTATDIRLAEPVYDGPGPNTKPMFSLSWDAYPDANGYEIAFYAEGEDSYGRGPFAIRSTRNIFGGLTEASIIFLQGVYTDTVTYRMKVRPRIGADTRTDPEDYIWSNLWEIRFVDGDYTVTETDADFDAEIAAAEAEKKAQETPTPVPTPTPEQKAALPHTLPEPLLTFLARENGEETPYEAGDIARLSVTLFQGEAGASTQNIGNADIIRQFRDALGDITVTAQTQRPEEEYFETDSDFGTAYYALNAEGESLFAFYLDGNTIGRGDQIYTLEGLEALQNIDGIMSSANRYDFWDAYEQERREYEDGLQDPEGLSLLDVSYAMHLMAQEEDDAVFHIGAYMDWNKDAGRLNVTDSEEIRAILKAMSETTIGERVGSPEGEKWHINFSWWPSAAVYGGDSWLGLDGDCVKIGDHYYRVNGIEKLYEAVDSPFLAYMRDYSTAPTLKPAY